MIVKNDRKLTIGDTILDLDNDKGDIVNISYDGAGREWATVIYAEKPRYYHNWQVEELKLFNPLRAQIGRVNEELKELHYTFASQKPDVDNFSVVLVQEMLDLIQGIKTRLDRQ